MKTVNPKSSGLERRLVLQSDVVSNVNDLRTGQLMEQIVKADRLLHFLVPGKRIVLVERNHQYLEEMLGKITKEFCPNNTVSYEQHSQPHYVVQDGQVKVYTNQDITSKVACVLGRVKHPDSLVEKILRKAQQYGRVSERNDLRKLMINDGYGIAAVAKRKEDIPELVDRIANLPYLRMEHYQKHRKRNGYISDHLNMTYNNGNPAMRGIEIEIQVTDLESHSNSTSKPEQDHDTTYGDEKLACEHHVDGQIVIVGNHIQVPGLCRIQHGDGINVVYVPNDMKPYKLIVPVEYQ